MLHVNIQLVYTGKGKCEIPGFVPCNQTSLTSSSALTLSASEEGTCVKQGDMCPVTAVKVCGEIQIYFCEFICIIFVAMRFHSADIFYFALVS